jgi:hypothetical protein
VSVDTRVEGASPPVAVRHPPRWLAFPVLVYVVSRVVQLMVIGWMHPRREGSVYDRLFAWDGGWFLRVAQEGYPHGYTYNADGTLAGNGLAFFPGYPLAIRLVHEVTRLPYADAALAVSWLAGAAAAAVVYRLGTRLYDARVGAAFVVLFCTQPMSVVLGMAYSEGLFVALAAGTLLAAHRGAWLTAGLLGLAAGLSRPTGVAVAMALAVAAALAPRRGEPGTSRWRPVIAAVVALCGVPAYLAFVALRVGNWHAWFDIQTAGWGSTFDFGASTARFVADTLRGEDQWVPLSVALILVLAVVSAVVATVSRTWPPLLVYGLSALVLVIGQSGYFHSKPRLLVPVLLVLVPPAVALGRARPRAAALFLAGWALFGFWYGAHMLTVWPYAI